MAKTGSLCCPDCGARMSADDAVATVPVVAVRTAANAIEGTTDGPWYASEFGPLTPGSHPAILVVFSPTPEVEGG